MSMTYRTQHDEDAANLEAMLRELAKSAGFTEAEWSCLADITNGNMAFDPPTLRNIHGDIEDAEDCYFPKWAVSRADILAKLSKLDSLSRLAVVVHCRALFGDD